MGELDGRMWYARSIKEGKFIQAYVRGKPYIKMGTADDFHGILLIELLDEQRVHFKLVNDDDGGIAPAIKGDEYELVGAGQVDGGFAIREGEFVLYGESISYSTLKPNQKHLDDLAQHIPPGIKFTIRAD